MNSRQGILALQSRPRKHEKTNVGRAEHTKGNSPLDAFQVFRWLVVVAQATTILITWPLWQARTSPPMLPAIEGPLLNMGPLLLSSLVVVVWRPKLGVTLHTAVLVAAMMLDQMRLQPEFISQAILLWGTLRSESARMICRAHLIALWFFGGFHKLTSPNFATGDVQWLVTSLLPNAPQALSTVIGITIAVCEITLAITALIPSTRRFAVWLAYLLHLGVVAILSPLGVGWDAAVWPWNIALSVSGYVMIGSWQHSMPIDFRRIGLAARAAVVFILLAPFAYYPGLLDPYLCHLLYSKHVPVGWIRTTNGELLFIDTMHELEVPVPQTHRLYKAYFRKVGRAGDQLEVIDPRLWYRWQGIDRIVITYEQAMSQQETSTARGTERQEIMPDSARVRSTQELGN